MTRYFCIIYICLFFIIIKRRSEGRIMVVHPIICKNTLEVLQMVTNTQHFNACDTIHELMTPQGVAVLIALHKIIDPLIFFDHAWSTVKR